MRNYSSCITPTIFAMTIFLSARVDAMTPYDTINAAAASGTIESSPHRRGVTVLFGSGGNITVLSGADGKFLVDGGIALSRTKLTAALDAIGSGPIRYVALTHWHWDQSDSNGWLRNAGATSLRALKH